MADRLSAYRAKRDFGRTPEPSGERPGAAPGAALSFVVQKHAARQLHYDFRLELDGSLKSWAVPKGPSLDPSVKRMAVHVEDHPLDYGDFEGTIPEHQYGAGTVIVWDRGTWRPVGDPKQGYAAGKLKFELEGDKLHGGWSLVRMRGRGEKQEPWLLIKERDEAARAAEAYDVLQAEPDSVLTGRDVSLEPGRAGKAPRAAGKAAKATKASNSRNASSASKPSPPPPLPDSMAPELATLVDAPPPGDDWVYEIKFDGYRILARIDGRDVRLLTRNGHDWSDRMPGLVRALSALELPPCWLDGEIVVLGEGGTPDFQALQNAFDTRHTERIRYCVFDLLYLAGQDWRPEPLRERRAALQALLKDAGLEADGPLQFSADFDVGAEGLLESACRLGMEGVIGKRATSPYRAGRQADWIKLKCHRRQEFVIGGWTDPQGSRIGFGALLLGVHDDRGRLIYAGNVGTGFDERRLRELHARLKPLEVAESPFATPVEPSMRWRRGAKAPQGHWVRPTLVAEVSFAEWTKEGRVRQAVFQALRDDKPARAIVREEPQQAGGVVGGAGAPRRESSIDARASTSPVRITHADRVVDRSTGRTKQDLVDHYLAFGEAMLPHLRDRPVAVLRAPDGLEGEVFFQKHDGPARLPGVRQLPRRYDPGHAPLMVIDSMEALIGAVQMNAIEFHTWNATTAAIEQPDRMTFDLDPGEGVAWPQVLEAAELSLALLDELGLAAWPKTSGGKGLHLVVPLVPEHGWDVVKNFSQAIVEHLAATVPQRFVAKSGPRNRVGKVFVDYLRNGRGATTVAAFSVRARPGLGISVPLRREQLARLRSGDHWQVGSLPPAPAGDAGPWADYAAGAQHLDDAMERLGWQPPRRGRTRRR